MSTDTESASELVIEPVPLDAAVQKAATGDLRAFDDVFDHLGTTAWAMAICGVDDSAAAAGVVAQSFVALLEKVAAGTADEDPVFELLLASRGASRAAEPLPAPKKRRLGRKRPKEVEIASLDAYGALAFAALPDSLRTPLWLMEVHHLSSSTVAKLLGSTSKDVEDRLRQARMGFRRYYIEALPREGMGLECSTALDQVPDYTSGRLTAADTLALEEHFSRDAKCSATAQNLQELGPRLRDAMPIMPASVRTIAAARWSAMAPKVVAAEPVAEAPEPTEHDDIEIDLRDSAIAATAAAAGSATQAPVDTSEVATPVVDEPAEPAGDDVSEPEAPVVAPVGRRAAPTPIREEEWIAGENDDESQPVGRRFAGVGAGANATPFGAADGTWSGDAGYADLNREPGHDGERGDAWWINRTRRPAVMVGTALLIVLFAGAGVLAAVNGTSSDGEDIASENTTTSELVTTTTEAPATTSTTTRTAAAPTTSTSTTAEATTTTSTTAAAPTTPTTVRPATAPTSTSTTLAPTTTTVPPTTTTTQAPSYEIVDLTPANQPPAAP